MYYRKALCAQQENVDQGTLQITVHSKTDNRPVENALVRISYTGDPNSIIEEVRTDSSGNTPVLQLKTPPLEYSLNASEEAQPYAEYSMQIKAEDFHLEEIAGTEVLPAVLAKQPVLLNPRQSTVSENRIVIPPHTLFYEYPPKIQESEIKPVHETGEIVLSKVVIPEYIVVHDGPVGDNSASNYYVRYRDYIKNVASSEIYATWPDDTIRANILAIMSFTLNRVYTEWYRNKGKDYTITSSTAYDHKWIRGRNIFDSIDRIVDELFENYLSRPNVRQPILTQYCDGERVQCRDRGWMTQWGSKRLGDQGYSAIEILRYFYGNDMYINVAEEVSGIPSSWPGYWCFRQQSTPASGTAKCYQPGLPCSSKSKSGRNLWCPDSGLCPQIPEYFRSSGNRNRRLYHLVQNSGNLRRRHPDCRITINIIWRGFFSRPKNLI